MDAEIEQDQGSEMVVSVKIEKFHSKLSYSIEESPPWYLGILLGFQHYLTMFGSNITIPLVLASPLCINDDVVKGKLISTIFFMSGIATLLQTIFGNRLPIVQGGTFSYLVPAFSILTLPEFACPSGFKENPSNSTFDGVWKKRMLELQGAVMLSSLFQIFIGFSGLMGLLLRFIGPLTVAPTISLVGLSLYGASADFAGTHWGIASLTIGVMVVCSLFLAEVPVPLPGYSKTRVLAILLHLALASHAILAWVRFLNLKDKRKVVIAIATAWLFCLILTAAGAFDKDSKARTDARSAVLSDSPWFRVPYPVFDEVLYTVSPFLLFFSTGYLSIVFGQWGRPTVSVASVFGMLAGVLAGIVESIGDYYACANLCGAPPPPAHAVNRGIGVEGLACLFAGSIGTGNGTTSFSENVGAIGITRVGSRRVVQIGAICMIVLGILGKFGALFSTIPDPVVGGVFCCMFGMITAVGISNLQYVDLNSVRNLFIIGFAFLMGFAVPDYFNKNQNAIDTGVAEIDQILTVLLKTSMAVGGIIGVILDNLVPGTPEERGLIQWQGMNPNEERDISMKDFKVYDLPFGIGNSWKISKFLPFMPYHHEEPTNRKDVIQLQGFRATTHEENNTA